ncbi:MAG: [FeFe] hydrogenase H-cluster radical SAM maturase HydG [Candidatus Egerieousia sp.]
MKQLGIELDRTISKGGADFIDEERIENLLRTTCEDKVRYREIFDKSLSKTPLTLEETAQLLSIKSPEGKEELYEAARRVKREIYGNRIVIFAPLYIGNYCVNNCAYCGFKKSAKNTIRKTLTKDELINEVVALEDNGQKRLILVFGESPIYTPEFIADCTRSVYAVKSKNGAIRRCNINAAPLDIKGYKTVKEAGIGTYQIFQETYHRATYAKYHPADTIKGDYDWRLDGLDRAFEAGIDDLGIGALIGLYDWRFETLGLVSHAIHLKERFGVGPHTISFPRIRPAQDMNLSLPYETNDEEFKQLVATLRLAVPYTGMILTAREPEELRNEVIKFGISQIDAGTRLEIGGYEKPKGSEQKLSEEQFMVGDTRGLDETVKWLMTQDFIPSFCTSCYRAGRTGEHFMEFAIPGFIQKFCTPNALLTLSEYLEDYAEPETKKTGYALIERELGRIEEGGYKNTIIERINKIKNGERDLRF